MILWCRFLYWLVVFIVGVSGPGFAPVCCSPRSGRRVRGPFSVDLLVAVMPLPPSDSTSPSVTGASNVPSEDNADENTSDESTSDKNSSSKGALDASAEEPTYDEPLPDVDVTQLLERARDGSDTAREDLFRITYDELRQIAERELQRRHSGGTLSVTSVVNRAYERMVADEEGQLKTYANRLHFFGTAARAMRSAIIDYARYKTRQKRGGDQPDVALDDVLSPSVDARPLETLLTVETSLRRLESMAPDLARVVELTFFGGMLQKEIAELEGVDVRTVQRRWRKAKLVLRELLDDGASSPHSD